MMARVPPSPKPSPAAGGQSKRNLPRKYRETAPFIR